jgi:hypothetical protein
VNNWFHESNFEACLDNCRPMRVRKVVWSGTKGVGSGTLLASTCLCRQRRQIYDVIDEKDWNVRNFLVIIAETVRVV